MVSRTQRSAATASTSTPTSTGVDAATAKAWAKSLDFNGEGIKKLQVSDKQAATTGPAPLRAAFLLFKSWEQNDLGDAREFATSVGGKKLYALHTTTDGDAGYLELFDGRGSLLASGVTGFAPDGKGGFKPSVKWDRKPGAERENLAPSNISPSVVAYHADLKAAQRARSEGGATVTTAELRGAGKELVGDELTVRSIDGYENAALRRTLADGDVSLTASARTLGKELADLYSERDPVQLKNLQAKTGPAATGLQSAWAQSAQFASAELPSGRTTDEMAMLALTQQGFQQQATQVVPATRPQAVAALVASGASRADATAAVNKLLQRKDALYAGKTFVFDANGSPTETGTAVFAVTESRQRLASLYVPTAAPPPPANPGVEPRAAIAKLTGVDRDVKVLSTKVQGATTSSQLEWFAPRVGFMRATLEQTAGKDDQVSGLQIPATLEQSLKDLHEQRLSAWAGKPVTVAGWVGRDDARGPGFVIAYRDASAPLARLQVAEMRITLDPNTLDPIVTLTKKVIGAGEEELERDLALNVLRESAHQLLERASASDVARLEVALRTSWVEPQDLPSLRRNSPVGFDSATDQLQLELAQVWGDQAMFATFQKDGQIRLDER
ncbi:MAG: hypothetical protein IPJ65_24745 [Archangiaceae bacterium]|nr:hypothetical protein [Archangiaceae bacterium]